jgi:hypothetical protein
VTIKFSRRPMMASNGMPHCRDFSAPNDVPLRTLTWRGVQKALERLGLSGSCGGILLPLHRSIQPYRHSVLSLWLPELVLDLCHSSALWPSLPQGPSPVHAKCQKTYAIDPATKYCLGAPSISAFFAGYGWERMSLFSCRINSASFPALSGASWPLCQRSWLA